MGDLDRLRALVVADRSLLDRMLSTDGRAEFTAAVCALAVEHGLVVAPGDVEQALNAARRAWLERWV